jgi:hypothetical protein
VRASQDVVERRDDHPGLDAGPRLLLEEAVHLQQPLDARDLEVVAAVVDLRAEEHVPIRGGAVPVEVPDAADLWRNIAIRSSPYVISTAGRVSDWPAAC